MDDVFAQLSRITRGFRASVRDRSPLPESNFPASAELRERYNFDTARGRGLTEILADVSRWLENGTQ